MSSYNSTYPVFYIPFGEYTLTNYDFTELSNDKRIINGEDQGQENLAFGENIRILDSYPVLSQKILDLFEKFIDDIGFTAKFSFTTSWLTRLRKGDKIQEHVHKNCEFSGVLYFDDDYTGQTPLQFVNPLRHLTQFHDAFAKPSGYVNDWTLEPKKGLVIFFPSFIYHYALESESDKERRSLAFNLAPKGQYGNGDSTMDTQWLSS